MQVSTEYRGHHIDLSTVDLECAEDVWGIPTGSWLAFHSEKSITAIDHPRQLLTLRLARWTVAIEYTGVNEAWHSPASIALRAQRSTERSAMFLGRVSGQ